MHTQLFSNSNVENTSDIHQLVDQLNIGICLFDLNGHILEFNKNFQSLLNYTSQELKEKNIFDLFDKQDIAPLVHAPHSIKSSIQNTEIKATKKNNETIYFKLLTITKFEETKFIFAFQDITKEKHNEQQLLSTYKELEDVKFALDKATTVSITDVKGTILYVNDLFCNVSKYSREELLGQNHRVISSGYHSKEYFQQMWKTIANGRIWKGEVRNKTKDGDIWWADATIVPFLNDKGKPYQYVAIRSDITARKEMEEKIHHMAYYDFLTELPNSRFFETQLQQAFNVAQITKSTFSLMILELHSLKFVYDSLGKSIGDSLLKEAGMRLKNFIGDKGSLSRLEGYDFSAIFSNMGSLKANSLAQEIIHLFEEPFIIQNYELYLTTNIGINIYPDSGDTENCLLKNANSALYHAKLDGTNTYKIFSQNMDIESLKRFTLKNDIRKALKNDEFFVTYEPKINPKTNQIMGAEALARWEHPKWGEITPDEFIPLAEELGLIGSIGELMLKKVCKQNKEWQDADLIPISITVNFSIQQFLQSNLIEIVEEIITNSTLDPRFIEIEITKITLLEDEKIFISKVEKLKTMGIKIAIDGFRTGYSSLNYLQKIKANTLIVDPTLIKNIAIEPSSLEFVSAIVHLAKKLHMKTVVIGVETEEQLRLLKKIDCDEIQGYLFSKPLVAEQFEALLKKKVCLPNLENKLSTSAFENQREFFRIDLPFPMETYMTIKELGGKKVQVGSTKVLIKDIGAGGARIKANIKLPVRSDLVLQLTTQLFGETIDVHGSVVWNAEVNPPYEFYGIKFIADDSLIARLTYLLNQLQVKLRQNTFIPDCNFVTEALEQYFQNK